MMDHSRSAGKPTSVGKTGPIFGASTEIAAPSGAAPLNRGLVSVRGGWLALASAIVLCWPMLFVSAPLMFNDSEGYINHGRGIYEIAVRIVESYFQSDASTSSEEIVKEAIQSDRGSVVRSVPYSFFTYITSVTPIGMVLPVVIQTALVMFMLLGFLRYPPAPPSIPAVALGLAVAVLTPLPWFASYLMPDLLAATALLYAVYLVSYFDQTNFLQRLILAGIAGFAVMSHYGNIPLAAACVAVALLIRLLERRLSFWAIAFGLAPVLLAMMVNALVSGIAFDSASVTPKRLPILLARSIEDGPARWYLMEHCKDEHYATCDALGSIPKYANDVLFKEGGLARASNETLEKVRDEEMLILWRAFQEYPLEQTWSFAGNAVKQLWYFGPSNFAWTDIRVFPDGRIKLTFDRYNDREIFKAFRMINNFSIIASLAVLAWLLLFGGLRRNREVRDILIVLCLGLLVNAAIFGGLSAPSERYQGRVIWLLPAFAAIFWLQRHALRVPRRN
jgi:hypothetical protein